MFPLSSKVPDSHRTPAFHHQTYPTQLSTSRQRNPTSEAEGGRLFNPYGWEMALGVLQERMHAHQERIRYFLWLPFGKWRLLYTLQMWQPRDVWLWLIWKRQCCLGLWQWHLFNTDVYSESAANLSFPWPHKTYIFIYCLPSCPLTTASPWQVFWTLPIYCQHQQEEVCSHALLLGWSNPQCDPSSEEVWFL